MAFPTVDLVRELREENERLRRKLDEIIDALDQCEGNRGRFSTVGPHDVRCPAYAQDVETGMPTTTGSLRCRCGGDRLARAVAAYSQARERAGDVFAK